MPGVDPMAPPGDFGPDAGPGMPPMDAVGSPAQGAAREADDIGTYLSTDRPSRTRLVVEDEQPLL